jgi:hypothetical protein
VRNGGKGVAGMFFNIAVVCFTTAILEPLLKSNDLSKVQPQRP